MGCQQPDSAAGCLNQHCWRLPGVLLNAADFLLKLTTRVTRSATSRGFSCSQTLTEIQPAASSNVSVWWSRSRFRRILSAQYVGLE